MSDQDLPLKPISPEERQRTVDRLCAHFAHDHFDASELERRLDLAFAAQGGNELLAIERDLPALPAGAEVQPRPAAPMAAVDTSRPVSDSDLMVAVMGSTERKGNWTPPRRLRVLSIMGGADLDFRDALFATREVSITLFTLMGGVDILVPPGVRVEWNGVAIMGGFGGHDPATPPDPSAPVLRINGVVLMGGVDIAERLPGESAREARKRVKAERRAARRLAAAPKERG